MGGIPGVIDPHAINAKNVLCMCLSSVSKLFIKISNTSLVQKTMKSQCNRTEVGKLVCEESDRKYCRL